MFNKIVLMCCFFVAFQLVAADIYHISRLSIQEAFSNIKSKGHLELAERLSQIVKEDQQHIKPADLALVLEAVNTQYLPNYYRMNFNEENVLPKLMRRKILDLISDLVNGKKSIKNVLIAGCTRSGKSALFSTLTNPFDVKHFQRNTSSSWSSHTVTSKLSVVIFDANNEHGLFVARLIDTPGLLEQIVDRNSNKIARSDAVIVDDIDEKLRGIKVDTAAIVFRTPVTGTRREDYDAYKTLQDELRKRNIFSGEIIVVFSHADKTTKTQLKTYITELIDDHLVQKGITISKGSVFPASTIFNGTHSDRTISDRHQVMQENGLNVLCYRNLFLARIFGVAFCEYLDPEQKKSILNEQAKEKLNNIQLKLEG